MKVVNASSRSMSLGLEYSSALAIALIAFVSLTTSTIRFSFRSPARLRSLCRDLRALLGAKLGSPGCAAPEATETAKRDGSGGLMLHLGRLSFASLEWIS